MEWEMRERLAEFIFAMDYKTLSTEVIHQAKRCILDFFGVALAGSNVGLAPVITDIMCGVGGKEEATIIGDGRKIPVLHAALVNGVRGHTLDMDDGHRYASCHPGGVVIPAALAMAEKEDVSGNELIESIVVGYDTVLRVARAINPSHLQRGFHTTGTVGPFGAAAACCKLLGLKKEEVENALAIAGLQGAGLLEVSTSGQMAKPLHLGKAAQAGVLASLLAREGAVGPNLIFEGESGFLKAFSDKIELSTIWDNLGSDFEIMNTYFKIHAACRHVHPTLDAVKQIMDRNIIDINDIKNIDVHTYSIAIRFTGQIREAKIELAGKFSIPISVGLMLIYGKAGIDEYCSECMGNPLVQSTADKVHILADKEMDKAYPSKRGAKVTIETSQSVCTHEVDIAKGDPENPLDDGELMEKFTSNTEKTLPAEKALDFSNRIFGIEGISVRELMSFI